MRISDWSSDVCSSDLLPPSSRVTGIRFWLAYCEISRPVVVSPVNAILAMRGLEASGLPASRPKPLTRSEERRVGKEGVSTCRSRCWPDHYKKKQDTLHIKRQCVIKNHNNIKDI